MFPRHVCVCPPCRSRCEVPVIVPVPDAEVHVLVPVASIGTQTDAEVEHHSICLVLLLFVVLPNQQEKPPCPWPGLYKRMQEDSREQTNTIMRRDNDIGSLFRTNSDLHRIIRELELDNSQAWRQLEDIPSSVFMVSAL